MFSSDYESTLTIVLSVFLLVSCIFDAGSQLVEINFDANGGEIYLDAKTSKKQLSLTVAQGTSLPLIIPKIGDGTTVSFLGWYSSDDVKYTPGTVVKSKLNLTAKWEGDVAGGTSEKTTVATTGLTTVEVKSSPVGSTDTESNKTEVTLPDGSITTNGSEAKVQLSVTSYPIEYVSENASSATTSQFQVTDGNTAVAAIDCKLEVTIDGETKEVTSFNDKEVTVSTYIVKGLEGTPVVKYAGDVSEVFSGVEYNSSTGLLTFKTTHFSTFYVEINAEAYIVETNIAYKTLAEAVSNAKESETVVLIKNITLEKELYINSSRDFTLDLNGKTIENKSTGFEFTTTKQSSGAIPARFMVIVDGKLTVCDSSNAKTGKISASNYNYSTTKAILVKEKGSFVLNSGNIYGEYAAFYVVGYTGLNPESTTEIPSLTLNGGTVSGLQNGIGVKGKTAILTVNNGATISVDEQYAIVTNGTTDWYDGGNCKITINAGSISSNKGVALYNPAESIVKIYGGTLRGATCVGIKGGNVTISGSAKLIATGENIAPAATSSGITGTGATLYVEDTYDNHSPTVNLENGEFFSKNGYSVQYFSNKTSNQGSLSITGGVFSTDPSEYVASGYIAKPNTPTTGKWTVVENKYWSEFADTSWYNDSTTEFALDSAEELAGLAVLVNAGNTFEGKTIKLTDNIDLSENTWIPIGNISCPFLGGVDGQTYTIKGLRNGPWKDLPASIKDTWGVTQGALNEGVPFGFIGTIGSKTGAGSDILIQNINFTDVDINCEWSNMMGVLVGADTAAAVKDNNEKVNSDFAGNITIKNITVSGSIVCTNSTGATVSGIVGKLYTKGNIDIQNCTNNANISCEQEKVKISGIVGYIAYFKSFTMKNCINNGSLTLTHATGNTCMAGGLVTVASTSNYTASNSLVFNNVQNNGDIICLVSCPNALGRIVAAMSANKNVWTCSNYSATGKVYKDTNTEMTNVFYFAQNQHEEIAQQP